MVNDVNPGIPHPEVLAFLRTRRSRPSKTLTTPVPSRAQVQDLLTMAARSPAVRHNLKLTTVLRRTLPYEL